MMISTMWKMRFKEEKQDSIQIIHTLKQICDYFANRIAQNAARDYIPYDNYWGDLAYDNRDLDNILERLKHFYLILVCETEADCKKLLSKAPHGKISRTYATMVQSISPKDFINHKKLIVEMITPSICKINEQLKQRLQVISDYDGYGHYYVVQPPGLDFDPTLKFISNILTLLSVVAIDGSINKKHGFDISPAGL